MLDLRVLDDSDAALLDAFLAKHRDTSMFLRSNARQAGVAYAGQRMQATYAGGFRAGQLVAVAAHAWNGMLLLQAPESLDGVVQYCADRSRRPIRGLSGPLDQVQDARRVLGLAEVPASLEEDEALYVLDLRGWVLPDQLWSRRVSCRAPLPSERDTLRGWRHAYEVEVLGRRPDDEAIRAQSATWLDEQVDGGVAWVAVESGRPVAYAAFNAALPDIVQVGGVYTPPAFRGRGYAKAVVSHSVRVARQAGAERAVLFTSNPNAVQTYTSIGFRRSGDFGLVLFI